MTWVSRLAVFVALLCLSSWASADDSHDNFFASILLGGKKIGQVHYSVKLNEHGELEQFPIILGHADGAILAGR